MCAGLLVPGRGHNCQDGHELVSVVLLVTEHSVHSTSWGVLTPPCLQSQTPPKPAWLKSGVTATRIRRRVSGLVAGEITQGGCAVRGGRGELCYSIPRKWSLRLLEHCRAPCRPGRLEISHAVPSLRHTKLCICKFSATALTPLTPPRYQPAQNRRPSGRQGSPHLTQ